MKIMKNYLSQFLNVLPREKLIGSEIKGILRKMFSFCWHVKWNMIWHPFNHWWIFRYQEKRAGDERKFPCHMLIPIVTVYDDESFRLSLQWSLEMLKEIEEIGFGFLKNFRLMLKCFQWKCFYFVTLFLMVFTWENKNRFLKSYYTPTCCKEKKLMKI